MSKNISKIDDIAQALDIEDVNNEEIYPVEYIETSSSDDEYIAAKENITELIKLGNKSLSELASNAKLSNHPRNYEVLTELLKAMVMANRELMEIKKIDVNINADRDMGNAKTINQNLFVGSTAELTKLFKSNKELSNILKNVDKIEE